MGEGSLSAESKWREEKEKLLKIDPKLSSTDIELSRQKFLGELLELSTKNEPYPSFDELNEHYGEMLGGEKNLLALLDGLYVSEMQAHKENTEKQLQTLAKFERIKNLKLPDKELFKNYYTEIGKTEIKRNKSLTKLMREVLMREAESDNYVRNSIDQIVMARRLIANDLARGQMEKRHSKRV